MALFVLGFITAFVVVIGVVFGLFMAYDSDKTVVNYIILAMAVILGLVAGYATSRKTTQKTITMGLGGVLGFFLAEYLYSLILVHLSVSAEHD
jgi:hypothetical protein